MESGHIYYWLQAGQGRVHLAREFQSQTTWRQLHR